jgi:hypothetical protein
MSDFSNATAVCPAPTVVRPELLPDRHFPSPAQGDLGSTVFVCVGRASECSQSGYHYLCAFFFFLIYHKIRLQKDQQGAMVLITMAYLCVLIPYYTDHPWYGKFSGLVLRAGFLRVLRFPLPIIPPISPLL